MVVSQGLVCYQDTPSQPEPPEAIHAPSAWRGHADRLHGVPVGSWEGQAPIDYFRAGPDPIPGRIVLPRVFATRASLPTRPTKTSEKPISSGSQRVAEGGR